MFMWAWGSGRPILLRTTTLQLRRRPRLLHTRRRLRDLGTTGSVVIGIPSGHVITGMQVIGGDRRIPALTGLGRDITVTVIIVATGAGNSPVFELGAGARSCASAFFIVYRLNPSIPL
jgi:hypothetical protein